ncbi:Very-long-chain 3-oxoacyl-CoA reductase [Colletotrichum shisoi]|uniref:Very-long-chain 3-oxoacyl-CoA reductase n=1 Tax=Colletotrichum shisoi TaxID=2078593 RepID=A0A5Q4BUI5_9PEZI|nr:Very-long-chain 3-oxoacyl-CoA reductase [Colletotrichum shisoi]
MIDQALKVVGLVSALYSAYRLYAALAVWILPSVPLTRYQKKGRPYESWALVTGATGGIGLACAQELALRGFKIVLVGRNVDRLEDARALIESECMRRHKSDVAVRFVVLDAASSSPAQVQAAVDDISDLDVTVLINNVGGAQASSPPIGPLRNLAAGDVDALIDLNARFMARLTHLMLPILARNGPSLVLNVGSFATEGLPGLVMYSAAKGFVKSFTRALAREMKAEKSPVDVLYLGIGEVRTNINDVVVRPGSPEVRPGSPEARPFAKAAMDRVGRAAQRGMLEVTPWFMHAVQVAVSGCTPERLWSKKIRETLEEKRVAHEEKARKDE